MGEPEEAKPAAKSTSNELNKAGIEDGKSIRLRTDLPASSFVEN